MRRSLACLVAVLVMFVGSQARAALLTDWTLNLTAFGGPDITGINSLTMAGTVNLVQNVTGSPAGTPVVGDTFTLSNTTNPSNPISFTAAAYVNSLAQQMTPLLGTGQGSLALVSPQLTGAITALTTVGGSPAYLFDYNNPGNNAIDLVYTDPSNVTHVIATFTLTPADSGGLSTDSFTGGTGLEEGTTTLSSIMTVVQSGVLFNSLNQDLSTLGPLTTEMAALGSGLNYTATDTGSQILAQISSDDNYTMSINTVPEPASLLMLGSGVLGFAFMRRRGRKTLMN